MDILLKVPGLGKAVKCEGSASHSPVPLRYVWHHIQPHECGGATSPGNLVQLCDSCHYSVHRLMYQMARGLPLDRPPRLALLSLATRGYQDCISAGTVNQIPNEG
jgi:hypothetical protein